MGKTGLRWCLSGSVRSSTAPQQGYPQNPKPASEPSEILPPDLPYHRQHRVVLWDELRVGLLAIFKQGSFGIP